MTDYQHEIFNNFLTKAPLTGLTVVRNIFVKSQKKYISKMNVQSVKTKERCNQKGLSKENRK